MVKAVHDVSQDDSSGQLLNGIVPVFIKEIKMDSIDDVLDQIHTHIAKTDNIDPSLQKDFHELDKSIRAMNEVKKNNGAMDLAELDRQARLLAAKFETKHPRIGELIVRLSGILQGMGI